MKDKKLGITYITMYCCLNMWHTFRPCVLYTWPYIDSKLYTFCSNSCQKQFPFLLFSYYWVCLFGRRSFQFSEFRRLLLRKTWLKRVADFLCVLSWVKKDLDSCPYCPHALYAVHRSSCNATFKKIIVIGFVISSIVYYYIYRVYLSPWTKEHLYFRIKL
jgi:hypothetical protein